MKIYIAGHRGMVGSAIWRALQDHYELIGRSSQELDLRQQEAVQHFMEQEKPDVVIDAAARVGGILANNNFPYSFLMENLQIQNNLIDAARKYEVGKFIFLGSSGIYPKLAPQPLQESSLLRPARTYQSVVCHRQDCRRESLRSSACTARARLYQFNAYQLIRAL